MSEDFEVKMRIMGAAAERFTRFGFSKVTMDELAESLGMSKKTLYQHFTNKQDILSAMVDSAMQKCDVHVGALLKDGQMDFVDKLTKMFSFLATQYASMNPEFIDDMRKHAPEIWKKIDEYRHVRIREQFTELVREGIEKGMFRSDVDQHLVLLVYLTAVEHLINPTALAEIPYTASQVFDAITKVLFEGMLTDAGRAKFSIQSTLNVATDQSAYQHSVSK
ncbi:MAG: TetR/AcrR family transcriptional regulator [Bacteroidetes bacterium]|nr:TetR/AcrR family transcriptional regulator [Bacteroidota bacterium]